MTPLANNLILALEAQLQKVKTLHQQDLELGYGSVYLPYALAKKYPNADKALAWQYVFPSRNLACRITAIRPGYVLTHYFYLLSSSFLP